MLGRLQTISGHLCRVVAPGKHAFTSRLSRRPSWPSLAPSWTIFAVLEASSDRLGALSGAFFPRPFGAAFGPSWWPRWPFEAVGNPNWRER
eukprot:5616214-Pyramimonas_sp.AAC.1